MDPRLSQIAGRNEWRERLAALDASTVRRLETAYRRSISRIEPYVNEFIAAIPPNEQVNENQLRGILEYQRLIERMTIEMNAFSGTMRDTMSDLQEPATRIGADAALGMAQNSAPNVAAQIRGAWLQPDPQSIINANNYLEMPAMDEKLAGYGAEAAEYFGDHLLSGIAQGLNPRQTARLISQLYTVPYSWAENTTRTFQIYSYRTATHAAYAANPRVIEGWVWQAALDKRTCVSCIMQHGKRFPSEQILNDHHRGRCTPLPIVRGTTWHNDMESGADWLRRQPEADQLELFHNNRLYEAWRGGQVRDEQLSATYTDPVYGEMRRVASYVGIQRDSK